MHLLLIYGMELWIWNCSDANWWQTSNKILDRVLILGLSTNVVTYLRVYDKSPPNSLSCRHQHALGGVNYNQILPLYFINPNLTFTTYLSVQMCISSAINACVILVYLFKHAEIGAYVGTDEYHAKG